MLGIYVIVGASLLGAVSCLLIAWSLWTRSQARRRARPPLTTGQPPGLEPSSAPDDDGHDEPSTQFLSEAELFGAAGQGARPTQVLTEPAPRRTQLMNSGSSGSRRTQILAEPTDELEGREVRTEFLSSEELFPDEVEPKTAFMTDAELFGGEDEVDEREVPTQFLSDEELFGAAESAGGEVDGADHVPTMIDTGPPRRSEETVVLAEGAILDELSPPDDGGDVENDGFAVARPRHQHLDRPPVHRIPVAPPGASPAPTPRAPVPRAPTPRAPTPRAPTPRAPTPQTPSSPAATPPTPSPRATAPKKTPPSRLPASRQVAAPPPRAPVRPAPPKQSVVTPEAHPHPPSPGYAGFVGAPLDDDDDDDDDFDGDDPETEMVHQAELLRLMGQLRQKPPGSE